MMFRVVGGLVTITAIVTAEVGSISGVTSVIIKETDFYVYLPLVTRN